MIAFTPDSYIIGLWYLELPKHLTKFGLGGNVMAAAWREPGETKWTMRTRIRHYRAIEATAAELAHSNDVFSWMGGTLELPEETVMLQQSRIFDDLAASAGGEHEPEFFEVCGGLDRMHAIAKAGEGPEWFHMSASHSEHGGGMAR